MFVLALCSGKFQNFKRETEVHKGNFNIVSFRNLRLQEDLICAISQKPFRGSNETGRAGGAPAAQVRGALMKL